MRAKKLYTKLCITSKKVLDKNTIDNLACEYGVGLKPLCLFESKLGTIKKAKNRRERAKKNE